MKSNLEHAKTLRQLHAGDVLVLANAWDAGSARLFEHAGSKAIATTSAGLAWSNGYADGDKLPTRILNSAVAAIARVIKVPLTVDIEAGYSDDPSSVADLIEQLIDVGVVGINIEDGDQSVELLYAKIMAIRERVMKKGADLFINVRTDVYLRELVAKENCLQETVQRAVKYKNAGADGIFIPALVDSADIKQACEQIALPVNVMALQGLPDRAALNLLGVKRLSAGSAIAQAVLGQAQELGAAFIANGQSQDLFKSNSIAFKPMNAMF